MMAGDQTPDFFRGEWIVPDDDGYDAARLRVFNTRRNPRPPVVARCIGTADVTSALAVARAAGHSVAVRSTGWSLEGHSATDGLTIDLSLMRCVSVDPTSRTAWVQGGATSGDLQVEAGVHGLAAAASLFSGNGLGFLLGGGVGHLARRAGYGCDNILAVELVTAAGEVVVASPEENDELFWAVCGTQGNFGVVTGLQIQLHEVPDEVLAGDLVWTSNRIGDALRTLAEAAEWASDDLSLLSFHDPDQSAISVCHFGRPDVAAADIARLVSLGAPDQVIIGPTSYRDLTFARDEAYWPARVAIDHEIQTSELRTDFASTIEARLATTAAEGEEAVRLVEVHPIHRAMTRAPERRTAVHDRAVPPHWATVPLAAWTDQAQDDEQRHWVRESVSSLRATADATVVRLDCFGTNVMGSPEVAYGAALPRLRELKRTWDPDNVFRANLNIEPAEA